MPAYWLKPFGTTDPPVWTDPDWITVEGVNLDSWEILSGPRTPPAPGRTDRMIFTAVGHSRVFGAGEILKSPDWHEHPFWKLRFPWVYPVRVDIWLPVLTDGPKLSDVAPKKAVGRIRAGAPYAELTKEAYDSLVEALLNVPSVQTRA